MSLQGKLIEYIDKGKFICGLVLDDSGKRIRLLNINGREVSLPVSRIIHASSESHNLKASREELIKRLKEVDEARRAMVETINLEEVWDLVSEDAGGTFTPGFLADLCFGGEAVDDKVAAFLRRIFDDRLFFKYKDGKVLVHSAAVLEQIRFMREKEKQSEILLSNGAAGILRIWNGERDYEWHERQTCLDLIREYYLFDNEAQDCKKARELLKRAGLAGPHDAFHLLVKAGIWDKDENVPLQRYEIPVGFCEEALAQADAVVEYDVDALLAGGYRDFRDLPVLTIDGEATKDFDDALHLEHRGENYLVGVHIADVAACVKPGDPLFKEAMQRVTSLYFPDLQVPMLPGNLSEGVCSLIAGKARPALSFMVLLSETAEVLDFNIVSSLVEVKRQLSYDRAEEMLETDDELKCLAGLSRQLRQRRIEKGALLLPIPDVDIRVDAAGEGIDIMVLDMDSASRVLVAEFMILANELGAAYVGDRQTPGLFRSQEPPRQRLSRVPVKDLFINFRQRRHLAPGKLTTSPKPHSGIGSMQYTTLTSPIRRLLDLVMQHQIKHMLKGKGVLFSEEDLKDIAGVITTTQSKVNLVRQLRQRYWKLRYLESRVGERFNALILDKGPRKVQVLLLDFLLEGELPLNQGVEFQPADTISVKIARAGALDNVLRLEW